MFKDSVIGLVLRGFSLASRFILIGIIARYLSADALGIYGLMTASIGISIYLVGVDFYVFNSREILSRDRSESPSMMLHQVIFHFITYPVILPLLIVFFYFDFLPWKYLFWFYLLLLLEHASQEASRLFFTLSRPVMANVVFFCAAAYGFTS